MVKRIVQFVLLAACSIFVLKSVLTVLFTESIISMERRDVQGDVVRTRDKESDCSSQDSEPDVLNSGGRQVSVLPLGKLNQIRAVSDELGRLNAFVELLHEMDADLFPECAEWVARLPDGVPAGMERDAHWKQLLIVWGQRCYETALRFVLEPSNQKKMYPGALADVVHARADQDVDSLICELSELPEEKLSPAQMNLLAPLLFSRAPEQAMEWFEAFGDEALFASALAHSASYLAGHDLAAAAGMVMAAAQQNPSGARQAVLRMATEFSVADPEAGAEWIGFLEDLALRKEAFEHFFRGVSHDDPLLAVQALLELPYSSELAGAYSACALRLMKTSPEVAEEYIDMIDDPNSRLVFQDVLRQRRLAGLVQQEWVGKLTK